MSGQNENPEMEIAFEGTYEFLEPVDFEGQKYESVDYNLNKLRGKDLATAKRQAERIRPNRTEPLVMDDVLQAVVFAMAADLPAEFVQELGLGDYAGWAQVTQAFFGTGLGQAMARSTR